MNNTKETSVEELIIDIAKKVKGIGNATAGAIAIDFEGDLQSFLTSTNERLLNITNSSGRRILTPDQTNELLKLTDEIPKDLEVEETWVFIIGREFLRNQLEMVSSLSFTDFDVNPLLAKAINLDSPRKIITFNVYQTVTRSVVTSWGETIEKIARCVGCRKNDYSIAGKTGTNFDLVKTRDGRDFYIQVKSGPNTMNVGMVTSLNEAIEKLEIAKKGSKGILGMTYGSKDRISNQILSNLSDANDRMKIGREFWDFVREKDNYHKELFKLLDDSSIGLLNKSFTELIEDKITELEIYWTTNFSSLTVDEVLEKYI